jgi:hypothetical protein
MNDDQARRRSRDRLGRMVLGAMALALAATAFTTTAGSASSHISGSLTAIGERGSSAAAHGPRFRANAELAPASATPYCVTISHYYAVAQANRTVCISVNEGLVTATYAIPGWFDKGHCDAWGPGYCDSGSTPPSGYFASLKIVKGPGTPSGAVHNQPDPGEMLYDSGEVHLNAAIGVDNQVPSPGSPPAAVTSTGPGTYCANAGLDSAGNHPEFKDACMTVAA